MDTTTFQSAQLITLVQVARENQEIGKQLKTILSMNSFNRKSMLNTWIEELNMTKAPTALITALTFLLNDEIAEAAMDIITKTDE